MKFFLKTLESYGAPVTKNSKILDFGCGNGACVKALREAGFEAYGCDLKFKIGQDVEALRKNDFIQLIEMKPYALPYVDNSFDYVISETVFEHVQNTDETLSEISRILKTGGISLHYFPSKWGVIESHILVPFASVFNSYPILLFWAILGLRTRKQKGMDARSVAAQNHEYLHRATHYLSTSEIKQACEKHFKQVHFIEKIAMPHSTSRLTRSLAQKMSWFPFLPALYRTFKAVVVLTVK